ncbi:hypothetical protein BDV59DRAFT_173961 [Aspergillus ambiguus]|uniref:uncharacterized protein n=1 Tax=Aspergillus ambiguus TaxID=176160 RepID=UPI003CCCCEB2
MQSNGRRHNAAACVIEIEQRSKRPQKVNFFSVLGVPAFSFSPLVFSPEYHPSLPSYVCGPERILVGLQLCTNCSRIISSTSIDNTYLNDPQIVFRANAI